MNHAKNVVGSGIPAEAAAQGWQQIAPEQRQPEIDAQIEYLAREAAQISAVIDSIEGRFSKVMQAPSPVNTATGAAPYYTQLGGELGDLVERLRSSRHRLESILDRAEL